MTYKGFRFPEGSIRSGSEEENLIKQLDPEKMPQHLAIIMDGNGRWAKGRGLPRVMGHREGVKSVRAAVENCARLNIAALTIYAFSTENWNRPKREVDALMKLLSEWIRKEVNNLVENGIRFRPVGRWRELPERAVSDIEEAIAKTAGGTNLNFQVALNYGGRAEIVDSIRAILAGSDDKIKAEEITEDLIGKHLYVNDLPDPDLLVRTSGELRVSNFLLWEIAYSEFYITDTYWPDFRLKELLKAVKDFQGRNRRFGGLKEA